MSDTTDISVEPPADGEAARLAALPPQYRPDGKTLHPEWNEGQELPVEPFPADHQSNHPQEDHGCGKCGQVSRVGVPDDPFHLVWECPFCGTVNRTPGTDPAELAKAQAALSAAVAAVEALKAGETPPVQVSASDAVGTGEVAG